MSSGERVGQVVEVEEQVARAWLASGKATEAGARARNDTYEAMPSVPTGPPEFEAMPSVPAGSPELEAMRSVSLDEQGEEVEQAEVQETPEQPKRRTVEPVEDEKPETR